MTPPAATAGFPVSLRFPLGEAPSAAIGNWSFAIGNLPPYGISQFLIFTLPVCQTANAMKKLLLSLLLAFAVLALLQSCQASKHHGYVSKTPCHQMHPCSH
jgi:hypothetical protein